MQYSEKFKDPRWQKKRLEILQRDHFSCQHCGSVDRTLHVHHKSYIRGNDPWDYHDRFLITLCADCHESEHYDLQSIDTDDFGRKENQTLKEAFVSSMLIEAFNRQWNIPADSMKMQIELTDIILDNEKVTKLFIYLRGDK